MANQFKTKYFLLVTGTFVFIIFISMRAPNMNKSIPKPAGFPKTCPFHITKETITPLNNTKHLLVSAYMDQRVEGFGIRIIGIFRRDSIQPLHCLFCCKGYLARTTTPAKILEHRDNFGFAFVATDVMCPIPQNCIATHVTLLLQADIGSLDSKQMWLPIGNQETNGEKDKKLQFNFTVCISNLFGEFNNVLQYAQTLEMYRLLGVDRVVIYNTSCGPDLNRLLQIYSQEGFVEMVPWSIDHYLNPSRGWLFSAHGGDVHYFGQLATLNDCILRSMDRSRYVLLNDIDEIIMPYKHNSLTALMNMIEKQYPDVGVFLIENHIFPKELVKRREKGLLPQWKGVPGYSILEHVYRDAAEITIDHPHKLLVKPRAVDSTSVHSVPRRFGALSKMPPDFCRIIHSPLHTPILPPLDRLRLDTRLWDFNETLIPSVNRVLRRAGLLLS